MLAFASSLAQGSVDSLSEQHFRNFGKVKQMWEKEKDKVPIPGLVLKKRSGKPETHEKSKQVGVTKIYSKNLGLAIKIQMDTISQI